jgi:O-antigen/teichoic acid export membrane protein
MRKLFRVGFVRDVALTGGVQAGQAVLAMAGGVIVARALGPSGRGTLSVLAALSSIAVLLGTFGFHQATLYFLGRRPEEREEIIANSMTVALVGGPVVGCALLVVGLLFREAVLQDTKSSLFFVFVLSVPFSYFTFFARRFGLGLKRVDIYNLPDIVQGISLFFGTGIVLLVFGPHVLPVVVLRVATEVGIALAVLVAVRRQIVVRVSASAALLRAKLAYGIRNYASAILWSILLQSDLVLCGHFLGNDEAGVYSVAVSLGYPVTLLGGVVGTLVFQRTSSEARTSNRIANTNRVVRLLTPLLALAAIGVGLAGAWLVPTIYGADFSGAVSALLLLLPGLVALSIETVVMSHLTGGGSPPIVFLAPLLGVTTNLAANIVVIPRWGIDGASVTSTIGYVIVLCVVIGYYRKVTRSNLRDMLILRGADIRALAHPSRRPAASEAL